MREGGARGGAAFAGATAEPHPLSPSEFPRALSAAGEFRRSGSHAAPRRPKRRRCERARVVRHHPSADPQRLLVVIGKAQSPTEPNLRGRGRRPRPLLQPPANRPGRSLAGRRVRQATLAAHPPAHRRDFAQERRGLNWVTRSGRCAWRGAQPWPDALPKRRQEGAGPFTGLLRLASGCSSPSNTLRPPCRGLRV